MCDQKNNYPLDNLIEERNHVEGLLNQRFNFFLVVFAAFLAALFSVKSHEQFKLIVIVVAAVEVPLALVIYRAQVKLRYYLKRMKDNQKDANRAAEKEIDNNWKYIPGHVSRNSLIGVWIPFIISIVLIIGTFNTEELYDLLTKQSIDEANAKVLLIEEHLDCTSNQLEDALYLISTLEDSLNIFREEIEVYKKWSIEQ